MAIVRLDALRSVAHGSITNSYTALGSAFTKNLRIIRLINNTDADMLFSFDGTTDNIYLPAFSFVLYDVASNALNVQDSDWFVFQLGTQIYIKYNIAPTTGVVYVEGVYSQGV